MAATLLVTGNQRHATPAASLDASSKEQKAAATTGSTVTATGQTTASSVTTTTVATVTSTAAATTTTGTATPPRENATTAYNDGTIAAAPLADLKLSIQSNPQPNQETLEWVGGTSGDIEERVDMSAGTNLSTTQMAAPQLASHAKQPGYQLVSDGPVALLGHSSSFQWIFTYKNEEYVDWFFSRCGNDLATLGVSPTTSFASFLPEFTDFVNSVQATCD